jgi:hypothetical protein
MNNGFNNIQNESFNPCANVNNSRNVKKSTNPFKYKCEALPPLQVRIGTN